MGIKVDVRELAGFSEELDKLSTSQKDAFFEEASKDMAARLIALVKPKIHNVTGTLARGWDTALGEANTDHTGREYSVTLVNDTPYASYHEYGHRQTPGRYVPAIKKRLKASWANGKFTLRTSESELETYAPTALKLKLNEFLKGVIP